MRIGVAREDITPPSGIDLTGFIAREGPCTGVHDPLFATALVAEEDGHQVALVSCDLIGLGASTVRRVRARIQSQVGIPAGAQLYACTHTHAGPETGVLTSLGIPDPSYLTRLESTLVAAVNAATARLQPALLGWERGACPTAAHNRVLARAGRDDTRIDPEVLVARVATEQGSPLAALVHYTCHPVAAGHENRQASADWCGVVRRIMEAAGTGPVVIVNGAGGDINPRMTRRGFAAVETTGRAIADVALARWETATPTAAGNVGSARADVPLALLPPIGPEELARLIREWDEIARANEASSLAYRSARITLHDYACRVARIHWGSESLARYSGETQVLRIGPLAIAALPGEFFSAYGQGIKQASRAPATLIAGWANDNLGYFPTAEAFPIGGYEMDTAARYYGYPGPWSPEAGAAVTTRAIELVRDLFGR